jgi:hypothetical protein
VLRLAASAGTRAAVALDARMLPHEWIRADDEEARRRYVKVDALEHHDDHFYPGPHDVAWDVAATLVEFDLDSTARRAFLDEVERRLGAVSDRIEFFLAAYVAFRAAYCGMGAGALSRDDPDHRRLAAAAARYRSRLAALLDAPISDAR